jgi:hypothetical protein
MQKRILAALCATGFLALGTIASAATSCDAINRELKAGRWPVDVALDKGMTLAQVESCRKHDAPGASQKPVDHPKYTHPHGAKKKDK